MSITIQILITIINHHTNTNINNVNNYTNIDKKTSTILISHRTIFFTFFARIFSVEIKYYFSYMPNGAVIEIDILYRLILYGQSFLTVN